MLAAETKVGIDPLEHFSDSVPSPARAWKAVVEPVEPFLEEVAEQMLRQAREFDPQIVPYAEFALNNGGKNLRPALVGLVAGCLGRPKEAHVTVAVIIEMIHLATLAHDDVMDEAMLRRGAPTLAARWGNKIAVLLGDCLFAQALTLASSFLTNDVCRAISAATRKVCAGEIIQTRHRGQFEAARRDYFRVIEMKTGELFTLSCDLAAGLAGATPAQRAAARAYGTAVGTAYQIFDDCVDLFGSEAETGKTLGTDLAQGKLTWPVLLAWERAEAADRKALEELAADWRPEHFAAVHTLLVRYQTLAPAQRKIAAYLDQARQLTESLPPSPGRTGLVRLADYLAQQTGRLVVQ